MAYPTGQLLSAPITNGSEKARFGTHIDYLGTGGYRAVASLALRDAIPTKPALEYDGLGSGQRRIMMLVAVQETGLIYILNITDYLTLPSDADRLAALANNSNWMSLQDYFQLRQFTIEQDLTSDNANAVPSVKTVRDAIAAIQPPADTSSIATQVATLTANGGQVIALTGSNCAVYRITALEASGGTREVWGEDWSVTNNQLSISADANLLNGDKLFINYQTDVSVTHVTTSNGYTDVYYSTYQQPTTPTQPVVTPTNTFSPVFSGVFS